MQISADESGCRKVTATACCFMGLSHILYLKEYVKGALYALMELMFLALSPMFFIKIRDMVTLGSPKPNLPVK